MLNAPVIAGISDIPIVRKLELDEHLIVLP